MQREASFNCSLLQKIGHRMFKYLALIYRKTFKKKCVDVRGAIDNRWLIIIQIHLFSIFHAYTNELFRKPCLSFPLFVGLDKTTRDFFLIVYFFWSNFFSYLRQRFSNITILLVSNIRFLYNYFHKNRMSFMFFVGFFQVKFDWPTVWPWS